MVQVFGSVTSWRTEGQDQMLLLLDDTIINGFCATSTPLERIENCPYLVAESTERLQRDDP